MIRGLWISASSLSSRERAQEILSNNLANVGTPGFRQMRFAFQQAEEAVRPPDLPGGSAAPAQSPGLRTRVDLSPSALETTGNPFDLALAGPGFFVVQGPEGPLYTREAALVRGIDGTLLHRSGYPILTEGGPLTISEQSTLSVSDDGTIAIDGVDAGRFQVADLGDPASLSPAGQNLIASATPGEALAAPRVVQGAIESANADPVETMIDMMAVLRAYQANQSAIMTQDESLGQLIRWASS